jgi:DNA-binding NtrC family response regulator
MKKILLVDNEREILKDRSKIIRDLGYECIIARDGKKVIEIVKSEKLDLLLTDLKMPNMDGISILQETLKIKSDLPVVIFTAYGTIKSAVQAMKLGAFDFIQKPISPEVMEIVIAKAIEFGKIKEENISLKAQLKDVQKLDNMVYTSPIMRQIAKNILKLSKSQANVLIFGESGTGKELIARSIHIHSTRKNNPFIPIDCVALPATLLESELFGFEKGAFTGAIKSKPGIFELADKGTLFFDEIIELDFRLQAKLLRVLQERQFRRLGGKDIINVDTRIISATNRNPEKAIREKLLREDLYYRLNVIPLFVPPLRDRREDIPLLVHHFIKKYNPISPNEIHGVSRDAMACLCNFSWPGNIRELENIIQRVMSTAEKDIIKLEDLPEGLRGVYEELLTDEFGKVSYKEAKDKYLKRFRKQYIKKLLKIHNGNISKVSRSAGICRNTIYRIIEEDGS